jgi:2-oxoglutarate ferredoxin oxidoreductase subunit beta
MSLEGTPSVAPRLTESRNRKDYLSSIEPKWCAGCGCYSILKYLSGTFPGLDVPREKVAVISGIGCSSRLPYYVDTYGFHSIHGRPTTVATGLKVARPDLSVWVITGDGDALSIGGNHFIKMVLFNNGIYGLTKGQASPTTRPGTKTKSTPFGSFEAPINPLALAIAAGATFAARVADTDGELMGEVMAEAAKHRGVAFIEIMLNCVIFNDGNFAQFEDKATRIDSTVRIRPGEPLLFGAKKQKGLRVTPAGPEVVDLALEPDALASCYVHDATQEDASAAYALSQFAWPQVPLPMGVFRRVEAPVYDDHFVARAGGELDAVLRGTESWREDSTGRLHVGGQT